MGPGAQGWFFAFQAQGFLFGDSNPMDWTGIQSVSVSGTLRVKALNGRIATVPFNIPWRNDGPPAYAINQTTRGAFDWTDLPGYPYYAGTAVVIGADLTFNFLLQLIGPDGASCDFSFSLHLVVNDKKWDFYPQ